LSDRQAGFFNTMEDFRIAIRAPLGASFRQLERSKQIQKEGAPSGINFSEGAL
jgi:hypothetical protein